MQQLNRLELLSSVVVTRVGKDTALARTVKPVENAPRKYPVLVGNVRFASQGDDAHPTSNPTFEERASPTGQPVIYVSIASSPPPTTPIPVCFGHIVVMLSSIRAFRPFTPMGVEVFMKTCVSKSIALAIIEAGLK